MSKRLEVIQTLARLGPVPSIWTEIRGAETVASRVEEARRKTKDLEEKETHIFSALEPKVMDVVDHNMLVRYRTNHQSRLGRLLGLSYRSDRRAIRVFQIGGETTSITDELEFVEEIVELQRCLQAWQETVGALIPQLEHRYAGRGTNWEAVLQDIGDVEALLDGWPGNRRRLMDLLTGEDGPDRSRELVRKLESGCVELEDLIQTGLDTSVRDQMKEGSLTLSSLEDLVQDATFTVERIEDAVDGPLGDAQETISDLKQFRDLMESGARLTNLEREHFRAQNALKTDFGTRFKSFETDWSEIVTSLEWTDKLLKMVGPEMPSADLMDHALRPRDGSYYESIAHSTADTLREAGSQTAPLLETYDFTSAPWESWEQAEFQELRKWSQELSEDADSAGDWLLYKVAVADLDRLVGAAATDLIRQVTDDGDLVSDIIEHRALLTWLDWVYQQEPALAGFTPLEQEDLIVHFRELDEQLVVATQQEVARRVFGRYPDMYASDVRAGELVNLLEQLSKKRGQWPVRRLIRTIPRLIQTLKPCFLMIPQPIFLWASRRQVQARRQLLLGILDGVEATSRLRRQHLDFRGDVQLRQHMLKLGQGRQGQSRLAMHLPPQRVDLRLGRGGVKGYQSPLARMVLQFPDEACYLLDGVEDVHA